MNSDPNPEPEAGVVRQEDARGDVQQVNAEVGNLRGVPVSVAFWQPRGHHVGVVDCLHLVHVETVNARIECPVECVEEVEQLERTTAASYGLEPVNFSEADGGGVEHLGC